MAEMEIDTPLPAAAKKKGGKDDGKKRFEVKKVSFWCLFLLDCLAH